jgi:hypothetical protein
VPFLVAAVLVVVVHLATALGAWTGVGLLADDHEMIGGAVLRHRGVWTLGDVFAPAAVDPLRPLYRPFVDLAFWLEQPVFGIDAFGYHVTNSVLHCATALLWFVLVRRWTASVFAATAAAVLFVGWPGHSEATHWIAARTNVMSTCVLSVALLVHDVGLARRGAARWSTLAAAGLLAAIAIATKESAVFVVPIAAVVTWGRAGVRAGALAMLPMVLASAALLAWRAHCLHTWGSGPDYGWHLHHVSAAACVDWVRVLLAPVHTVYAPAWAAWFLPTAQVALLVLAATALRANAPARAAAAPALTVLALGYLAGIGLEHLDLPVLENVRYTYEAALGLCVLCALGLAALPDRARMPALVAMLALHALVLDANRQSWLRASAVDTRLRDEVFATARATQQPVRVYDAPGVQDGAFALLNGYTQFFFWKETAPPGTNLTGAVSSTIEWRAVLPEIAAAAAAKKVLPNTFVARWADGALAPFALDEQWPHEPWNGTRIAYARAAREQPFVGDRVPVHVLVQTAQDVSLRAIAGGRGGQRVVGDAVRAAAGPQRPVEVTVRLPPSAGDGTPVPIALHVEDASGRMHDYSLGAVVPVAR